MMIYYSMAYILHEWFTLSETRVAKHIDNAFVVI